MNQARYVDESLALRRSHPRASALDVLDLVMQGHNTATQLATAPWFDPSHPFAAVVCEAFDRVMTVAEWRNMTWQDQEHREDLLKVWRDHVVTRFLARYCGEARDLSPSPPDASARVIEQRLIRTR